MIKLAGKLGGRRPLYKIGIHHHDKRQKRRNHNESDGNGDEQLGKREAASIFLLDRIHIKSGLLSCYKSINKVKTVCRKIGRHPANRKNRILKK